MLLRKPDGTLLRLPDGVLHRIIAAVEQEGIGEVTVVGHIDVVSPCPNEGTYDGLGEKVSIGVAGLDASDPDMWRDSDDSDSVGRRRDSAGRVGAMAIVILRGDTGNWRTRHAVHAVGHIDVWLEIWMGEVDPCVDVPNQHRGAATRDGVGLSRVDLPHVPLQG